MTRALVLSLALWSLPAAAQDGEADPAAEEAPVAEEVPAVEAPAEETAEAAEAPAPEPAVLDAEAQARIEALEAELAALRERVDEQADEQNRLRLKLIPADDLTWKMTGEYWTRGHVLGHFFSDQEWEGGYQDARYMQHRLRLQPQVSYKDLAKLHVEILALDGVVWGDNASLSSTAVFAGDPSETGLDGQEVAPVKLRRAWMELTLPVGVVRAGRMESQWGMGLLANDGNGFSDTFGEKRHGNTFDRVLFATRPLAIAQAIAGKPDSGIPLFAAVAVDRLVEEPLYRYYGYKCASGIDKDAADYDLRCDQDGDGTTDRDHSWTDDSRTADQRGSSWWQDQDDDVWEVVYVLIYRGEDVKLLGSRGDLTAGTYIINRKHDQSDSNVWIGDVYVKGSLNGVIAEAEWLTIRGRTRAITLPGGVNTGADDPLLKTAGITGYVARAGYERGDLRGLLEVGYASGDENVADTEFTGRPLHPDHNVGLLLYEEVLAHVTRKTWTTGAEGLWSNGGVYNSRYLFPNARWSPIEGWDVLAGVVLAWPDRPDGAVIQCKENETSSCSGPATADMLGWEIDLGLHVAWHKHLRFALEGAYAKATDRLPLQAVGLDPDGKFYTVQGRVGFAF